MHWLVNVIGTIQCGFLSDHWIIRRIIENKKENDDHLVKWTSVASPPLEYKRNSKKNEKKEERNRGGVLNENHILWGGDFFLFFLYMCNCVAARGITVWRRACDSAPNNRRSLARRRGLVITVVKRSANCIIPLFLFLRLLIITFYSIWFLDCSFPPGFRKLQLP